jgi:hypothetical protein
MKGMSNLIRSVYDINIDKCKKLCDNISKVNCENNSDELKQISSELHSLLESLERGKIKLLYWV